MGKKYNDRVYALDTLCTADESKLFLRNNWQQVGQTKGYSSDTAKLLWIVLLGGFYTVALSPSG